MGNIFADLYKSNAVPQAAKLMETYKGFKTTDQTQELNDQKIRAGLKSEQDATAKDARDNEWLTESQIRTMVPDMGKDQYDYHMNQIQLQGHEYKDGAVKRKGVRAYWEHLLKDEGAENMIAGGRIELKTTRAAMDQIKQNLPNMKDKDKAASEAALQKLITKEGVLLNNLERREAGEKKAPIKEIDPNKYTPESLQKFNKSKDYEDLKPRAGTDVDATADMKNTKFLVDIKYAKNLKEAAAVVYKARSGELTESQFMQKGLLGITKTTFYSQDLRDKAIASLEYMRDYLYKVQPDLGGSAPPFEGESEADQMSYGDPVTDDVTPETQLAPQAQIAKIVDEGGAVKEDTKTGTIYLYDKSGKLVDTFKRGK